MATRLPASLRLGQSSSCLISVRPLRNFTTTSARNAEPTANPISPESPRFTPGLGSVQASYIPHARIRGLLPVLRDILHRENEAGERKYQGENLWKHIKKVVPRPQTTRETSSGLLNADPNAERNEWKTRMAAKRRKNLYEGIVELKVRTAKTRFHVKKKGEEAKARRAANKAERDARRDVELTSSTTTLAMQVPARARIPDPGRDERVAEMRARVQAIDDRKAADRQEALHTLYVHARDFITTEAQLDVAIDKCFGSAENPIDWGNYGVSVWDSKYPPSIEDKLRTAQRQGRTSSDMDTYATTARRRIQKIAEELTGGKIQEETL